jgi:RimJ/RimL family protein N-acetyltransferase
MKPQFTQSNNLLDFRSADKSDEAILLAWRNDELTRANSHHSDPISFLQHKEWFRKSLENPNRKIFIAMENNQSVGMIRLDENSLTRDQFLSWVIAPDYRGRGLGSRMLAEVCRRFPDFDLIAEIKQGNEPSRAMVSKCGFRISSCENGVETWLRRKVEDTLESMGMNKTSEIGAKIRKLIPGGSHT